MNRSVLLMPRIVLRCSSYTGDAGLGRALGTAAVLAGARTGAARGEFAVETYARTDLDTGTAGAVVGMVLDVAGRRAGGRTVVGWCVMASALSSLDGFYAFHPD